MKQQVNIFWFRRDLRLEDNTGLFHALQDTLPVLPLFIFDKTILERLTDKKDKRVNFIYEQLEILNAHLLKQNSSLLINYSTAIEAFKKITREFYIKKVYTNHDYEPYAITRDKEIQEFLKEEGIYFISYKDQVVFEKTDIMKADGTPYTVFTPYSVKWKEKYSTEKPAEHSAEKIPSNFFKTTPFSFPGMKEIGFEKTGHGVVPIDISSATIKKYHLTRNFPAANATSHASVHLRFGTISVRKLCKLAIENNEQWLNELIWREFFMIILFHFPHVVNSGFKKKYDSIPWRNNEKEFESWCKGETGYPIVDAGMRQLNATGYMHNRVRMITASFLTKHLLIDWRWGEAYFAEKLLDFELSSNNGNWQWAAGSGCDAAPYFRIFNPYEQVKKFDPQYVYIKKWIPDFRLDYLPPIVNHTMARERALRVYKTALQ